MAHAYDPHATTDPGDFTRGGATAASSRAEIDWSRPDAVSTAVVEALSDANGAGPTEIGPIYDEVDLEALGRFLTHRKERSAEQETSTTFTVEGFTVAINGDEVVVTDTP